MKNKRIRLHVTPVLKKKIWFAYICMNLDHFELEVSIHVLKVLV